jgi:hypothetical protein
MFVLDISGNCFLDSFGLENPSKNEIIQVLKLSLMAFVTIL